MNKHYTVAAAILLSMVAAAFTTHSYKDEAVPYPEGYRQWTHIKTAVIGPTNPAFPFSGGFHHIYANSKAMEGYTTGLFPEGSIIVFDVLEAIEKDGNTEEGKRRHIDVMVKDSTRYPTTSGWGYEEFNADSKTERTLTASVRANCARCHASQKDHVFSDWRK